MPVKEDKNVKAAVTHYSPPVTIKSSSNQPSLKVKDVVKKRELEALGGTVEQRAGVVGGRGRSKTTSSPRPTPKPTVQESHESNKVKTDESQVAITRKYRWSFRSKGPKKAPSTIAAATNVSPAENQPPKEKKESWRSTLTRTLSFRRSRRKRVRRETLEEQPTEASGQATGLNEREQKEEEKVQKRKEKAASLLPEDEIQKEEKTPPIKSKKEKAATLPLQKAENKPSLSFFQKLKKRFKKRKSYDVTKEKTAVLSKQEPSSGTVAQMKQQLKQKGMQTDEANSPEQSHTTKVAERKDASSPPRKVVAEAVVHTPERNGEAVGDKSKKVLKKIKTEDSKHFT